MNTKTMNNASDRTNNRFDARTAANTDARIQTMSILRSTHRGRNPLTIIAKLLLAGGLALSFHALPATAQTGAPDPTPPTTRLPWVNFGTGAWLDSGYSTKVVLDKNGNSLVVMGGDAGTLQYKVGTGGSDGWGLYGEPIDPNATQDTRYDNGYMPAISLNSGGTIVETHNSGWVYNNTLWYHVGTFSNGQVNLGPSIYFDWNSAETAVAVNDSNTVVEIHRQNTSNGWQTDFGWNHSTNLWYHVGTVNGKSINWGASTYLDTGNTPSVAVSGNTVVETHRGGSGNNLYYRVGTISGNSINWGSSTLYDQGYTPSICIANNVVFETHFDGGGYGNIYNKIGRVNGTSITWSDSIRYDYGYSSNSGLSIATNGNYLMEVHLGDYSDLYWSSAAIQW